MTDREYLLEKLADLVELGHSVAPGFIREVAEEAIAALSPQTLPAPGEVKKAATRLRDRAAMYAATKPGQHDIATILATVAAANDEAWPSDAVHKSGAWVQKKGRASWRGRIVGWYRTDITTLGYAVESAYEPGSVQIYPETALLPLDPAAIRLLPQGGGK